MDFIHFTAGKDDDGRRLDRILRRFLDEESLSSIYKSLRKGLVKVDGRKRDGDFRVSEGSDIQIAAILPVKTDGRKSADDAPPFFPEGSVIFRNESVLILNKGYDIPSQPSPSSKGNSLADIVRAEFERKGMSQSLSFRTGPLHRLDRKTTGLIAFSQSLGGARYFSQAMRHHLIEKTYLALLEGNLTESRVWEDKIAKKEDDAGTGNGGFRKVSVTPANEEEGRTALTKIIPLSHGIFPHDGKETQVTLARILIRTGRTHQIRGQSAYHGFPLLGDSAYGGVEIDTNYCGQNLFLHAWRLRFPAENPLSLPETLTAPPPHAFKKMIDMCGMRDIIFTK